MKTKHLFLIAIALVSCFLFLVVLRKKAKKINKKQQLKTEISENQVSETTKDIHNIPFSKANIACPSGNGLYGKFPLKQKWTTI